MDQGPRGYGPTDRAQVRRRRVFYIPGYDPMPVRKYRELYRREAARQADISGYRINVTGHPGEPAWQVDASIDQTETETRIEVLVWSDIVKASMDRGIMATYLLMARTAWTYIASGALWRLARLRPAPVIAALYPIAMLTLQLLAAVLVAWAVAASVGLILPQWLGWGIGLGALFLALRGFRAIDHRLYAYYLMQDYAYAAQSRGACPAALTDRIGVFADRIAAAMDPGTDELLVVGHSSGAHIAVMSCARLIRSGPVPDGRLSLLTLGHVVPMVSFLPKAADLRRDLALMGGQDRIAWVDVTAPGDGATFALCDPVAVSGVAPDPQHAPLVLSAAFSKTLAPETWSQLRRRFHRLHFQYLHAFDRPGDYDYFQITAGPLTLADRFAGRAHSRSRIARVLSGYRDEAP